MEKSGSLGTKSRRKRLWDYLGGHRSKLSAECHSVDCSGDSKVLTELQIAKDRSYCFRRSKVKRIETWCCPCGIVALNLENGSSVNSENFDATDLRF